MNTESQIQKPVSGWSAVRRQIANSPKPALIALVNVAMLEDELAGT